MKDQEVSSCWSWGAPCTAPAGPLGFGGAALPLLVCWHPDSLSVQEHSWSPPPSSTSSLSPPAYRDGEPRPRGTAPCPSPPTGRWSCCPAGLVLGGHHRASCSPVVRAQEQALTGPQPQPLALGRSWTGQGGTCWGPVPPGGPVPPQRSVRDAPVCPRGHECRQGWPFWG